MDALQDILYRLIIHLSDSQELSLPRLVKSLYLYDWSKTLNFNSKDSRLTWSLSMCGPSCLLVNETVRDNADLFRIYSKDNHMGEEKEMVAIKDLDYCPKLSDSSSMAIAHVVRVTKGIKWGELTRLISSTMPMIMASVGGSLDLEKAASFRRNHL